MRLAGERYGAVEVAFPSGRKEYAHVDDLSLDPERQLLASCLMVSRGNVDILRHSLACYLSQDYPERELVLVTDNASAGLGRLVASHDSARIKLIEAPRGLTLGELRNIAIAHSEGSVVCQWDDDDLYDPQRLSVTMRVMRGTKAPAAFLSHMVLWWPQRRLFALSGRRVWEGSMAASRRAVPVYPALSKGEDTFVADAICKVHRCALIDAPSLYCRVVTGKNTWSPDHFDRLVAHSLRVFSGREYEDVLESLAPRLPIREYAAALGRS